MDKSHKILILEDRRTDLELTKRAVLKAYPTAVITHAVNKDEFLQKINWIKYDLVLADYRLPDYNGLEALLYIREHYPHLPFIFVTGTLDSEESAAEAILRGANGYILKHNLANLPEQMAQAFAWAEKNLAARAEAEDRKRRRQLNLQKAIGLIDSADDFGEKNAVLGLLNQLIPS